MNYELPLVLFTVISQLAVGLSCCVAWRAVTVGLPEAPLGRRWDRFLVGIMIGLALIASLFHLAQPLRSPTAVNHVAVAWLSREILVFGVFALLALLTWLAPSPKGLAAFTAVVGLVGVVIQGFTYAPISMPAVAGPVPCALVAATALFLGAAFAQPVVAGKDFTSALRIGLGLFLVILLLAPGIWSQGGVVMRQTAEAWLHSAFYWAALALTLLALAVSWRSRSAILVCVLALAGAFAGRLVFFASTIHTATNIGNLY